MMSRVLHLSSAPRSPHRLSVVLGSDSSFNTILPVFVFLIAPFRWAFPLISVSNMSKQMIKSSVRPNKDSHRHHSTTPAQSVTKCDLLLLSFRIAHLRAVPRLYVNAEIRQYNYNHHCTIQNRSHRVLQILPLASLNVD
jgi:hypothetical protein